MLQRYKSKRHYNGNAVNFTNSLPAGFTGIILKLQLPCHRLQPWFTVSEKMPDIVGRFDLNAVH